VSGIDHLHHIACGITDEGQAVPGSGHQELALHPLLPLGPGNAFHLFPVLLGVSHLHGVGQFRDDRVQEQAQSFVPKLHLGSENGVLRASQDVHEPSFRHSPAII